MSNVRVAASFQQRRAGRGNAWTRRSSFCTVSVAVFPPGPFRTSHRGAAVPTRVGVCADGHASRSGWSDRRDRMCRSTFRNSAIGVRLIDVGLRFVSAIALGFSGTECLHDPKADSDKVPTPTGAPQGYDVTAQRRGDQDDRDVSLSSAPNGSDRQVPFDRSWTRTDKGHDAHEFAVSELTFEQKRPVVVAGRQCCWKPTTRSSHLGVTSLFIDTPCRR